MITPELVTYIRGELAKGKSREEIRGALIKGGGWSDDDLSEAFRTVIPMQGAIPQVQKPVTPAAPIAPTPSFSPSPVIQTPASLIPPISTPPPSFSTPPSFSPPPSFTPPPSFSTPPPPVRSFSTPSLSQIPPPSFSSSVSMPKQAPSLKPVPPAPRSSHSWLKFLIILIIIGGLGFGAWYFRAPAIGLWNSLMNKSSAPVSDNAETTPTPDFNAQAVAPMPAPIPEPVPLPPPPVISVKDCGETAMTLKLGAASTYEKDPALSCLGASALVCEDAKGIIKDNLFPTIFEISKPADLQGLCNFKLSYSVDSKLNDITGKKMALQYVSCPISIVKSIDNTKPATPKFNPPTLANPGRYAAEIYFYGTLGLFIENSLDSNKIQATGCSGEYIQSMIASYNAKK